MGYPAKKIRKIRTTAANMWLTERHSFNAPMLLAFGKDLLTEADIVDEWLTY